MSYIEKPFGASYCVIENGKPLWFQRIPSTIVLYPSHSPRFRQGYYWIKTTRWVSDGYRLTDSRLNILETMHVHRALKKRHG